MVKSSLFTTLFIVVFLFTMIIPTNVFADPVIKWNTFIGSLESDWHQLVVSDNAGNVYIAGQSEDSWGAPINPHSGNTDGTLVKLNSSGKLEWNTFLGTPGDDRVNSIVSDSSGNIYVVVQVTSSFDLDTFIAKLDGSGILLWSTFLGSGFPWIKSTVIDSSNNIYMTGTSSHSWGTPINSYSGGSDICIIKLNDSGAVQWNTFLGSYEQDIASSSAIDGSGNIYVTGFSSGSWGMPINPYTGISGYDGLDHQYVAKLNSSGSLIWNTFIVPSYNNDDSPSIAADDNNNVYVAASIRISWGNPINPYINNGHHDVCVAKLNENGILQWNTFMGSSGYDDVCSITTDNRGNIIVTGYSENTWGNPFNPFSSADDAFVAKLNSNGILQWNTFMGSSAVDYPNSSVVGGNGNIYIVGESEGSWGTPISPFVFGYSNVFVAKIHDSDYVDDTGDDNSQSDDDSQSDDTPSSDSGGSGGSGGGCFIKTLLR